jgi:hypothetical protein
MRLVLLPLLLVRLLLRLLLLLRQLVQLVLLLLLPMVPLVHLCPYPLQENALVQLVPLCRPYRLYRLSGRQCR